MGTKRSITTQKVLDLCQDEWRSLEEVVAAVLSTVPPGKALRHFESRTKRTEGSNRPEWTEDEKIRSGQRHFTMVAVRTLSHSGMIETRLTPEGEAVVRLAPPRPAVVPLDTCPHCLRPYDTAEPEQGKEVSAPFVISPRQGSSTGANVIYPQKFNQRRFG